MTTPTEEAANARQVAARLRKFASILSPEGDQMHSEAVAMLERYAAMLEKPAAYVWEEPSGQIGHRSLRWNRPSQWDYCGAVTPLFRLPTP